MGVKKRQLILRVRVVQARRLFEPADRFPVVLCHADALQGEIAERSA